MASTTICTLLFAQYVQRSSEMLQSQPSFESLDTPPSSPSRAESKDAWSEAYVTGGGSGEGPGGP